MTQCAHPDCTRVTARKSLTGVCRDHLHTDWCVCKSCRLKRDELPRSRQPDPVTRQPSMPVPPWEVA